MKFPALAVLVVGITINSPLTAAALVPEGSGPVAAVSVLSNGSIVVAAPETASQAPAPTDGSAVTIAPGDASRQLRVIVSDPAMLGSSASLLSGSGELVAEFAMRHVNRVDTRNWPAGTYTLRLVDGRTVGIRLQ